MKTYIVRFGGSTRWIDTTIPRAALRNPRLFARWFHAFTRKHGINWKELPACEGITQIAAGDGHLWHDVDITFQSLYWDWK
jgi:hypothetical protein